MTLQTDAMIAGYKAARRISGVSVVYARGAGSVTLTCVPGRTQFSTDTGDGIVSITNSDDFLILASELTINGSLVTPIRGDTITRAGVTYTVLTTGADAQYAYLDQEKKILRIHTRKV